MSLKGVGVSSNAIKKLVVAKFQVFGQSKSMILLLSKAESASQACCLRHPRASKPLEETKIWHKLQTLSLNLTSSTTAVPLATKKGFKESVQSSSCIQETACTGRVKKAACAKFPLKKCFVHKLSSHPRPLSWLNMTNHSLTQAPTQF